MILPLYENSTIAKLFETGNTGLWYNKFCNQWRDKKWSLKSYTIGEGRNKNEVNPKLAWIKTVTKKTGEAQVLQEAVNRRLQMVDKLNGTLLICKTVTPLVTGLGNPHPVENGFTWHHLFGTPYLPASSVKGLVRDWAANWDVTTIPEDINRIFGPEGEKDKKGVGSIIFLDAIPIKPVQLKAEIITPHYGDYYKSTLEEPEAPGDWLSPKPIPFLAVAEGGEFQFGLINRRKGTDNKDLEKVTSWLTAALETLGAGGKTAVGYGIMTETTDSVRKRNDKASELQRQNEKEAARKQRELKGVESGFKGITLQIFLLAAEENWHEDNAILYSGIEEQIPLIKLEENLEIQQQAANLLAEMLESTNRNKEVMAAPDKVTGKRKKYFYKPRVREIAHNLLKILNAKKEVAHAT